MLFSSATFLFAFLPVVALLYYLIPKRCTAARNLFLTGASLLFYAWGEPRFVLVMLLVIVSSWIFACKIEASAKSARKGFLLVAVSVDLTVLFVFKYLGFFTENLIRLPFVRLPVPQITLPIGISFFTFQAISYVVDVFRGEAAQKSLWDVMLYIAFFPQLIAGPIVRYSDFADQIHNRQESLQNWNWGGYRFAIGLGKKVILSNNLAFVADAAFSSVGNLSFSMAWIGAVGYSLQLYFDFSGYSDMAIGLGQMFGFHFLENFNYPFISRSITELWRRWHISLGSWFRDYVYIPLGGSRCRLRRTCLNLLIVFALTGLWHGAAWQYVVFGLLHGIILCMERLGLRRALEQLPRLFRHLYTVVLLWLTLVIFGAPGLSEGLAVLKGIFTWQSGAKGYTLAAFADTKLLLILAASFLLCGPVQALCPKLRAALYAKKAPSPAGMAGLLVLLFLGLMRVTAGTYSAFIYFQF